MNKSIFTFILIFIINILAFCTSPISNKKFKLENDCNIYDLYAEVTACEGEVFDVLINFEYENVSDSFRIQGNGTNYGHFAYNDLPITLLTLNADCETNYEFIAIDTENNDCSDATGIGIVCCESNCNLSELQLTPQECNGDNAHDLIINFDYENPGNDYFNVWVNQQFFGYYPLSQLPLTITLSNTNNEYDFVKICINDVPECCIEDEVENPCYEVSNDCNIYDLYAEVTACEGEVFDVLINFEYENVSDSFRIQGNGINYGYFGYNELPITLISLSADCETQYEFIAIDKGINYCSDFMDLGIVCCESECSISNLVLTTLECNEEEHVLIIDFDYENPGNEFFDLRINQEFAGYYPLSFLPISITLSNTSNEYDFVKICINDMPDCCIEDEVENPCYEVSNDCNIYDLNAEVTACEGEVFDVIINFEYKNVSDSFRIRGNGINYGYFAYSELPITLKSLAANCETNYEFITIDSENNDCSDATGIGIVCCDPAKTNELISENIDIFIRENKTLVVDFGTINFEKAELNIFNVVGQELMYNNELNNLNNLNIQGILSQSGLIFIQISIQTSKSNYMIIKKVIII